MITGEELFNIWGEAGVLAYGKPVKFGLANKVISEGVKLHPWSDVAARPRQFYDEAAALINEITVTKTLTDQALYECLAEANERVFGNRAAYWNIDGSVDKRPLELIPWPEVAPRIRRCYTGAAALVRRAT